MKSTKIVVSLLSVVLLSTIIQAELVKKETLPIVDIAVSAVNTVSNQSIYEEILVNNVRVSKSDETGYIAYLDTTPDIQGYTIEESFGVPNITVYDSGTYSIILKYTKNSIELAPSNYWSFAAGEWKLISIYRNILTGWQQDNGNWYFLDNNTGNMKTGWVKYSDTWYYLNSKGRMEYSTVIDGYILDDSGAWIA